MVPIKFAGFYNQYFSKLASSTKKVGVLELFLYAQITVMVGNEKSNASLEVVDSEISFIEPVKDQYVTEKNQAQFECILNRQDAKVKWIRYVCFKLIWLSPTLPCNSFKLQKR